ncbi:tetratricopeptide repeat protein, partial [Planktothrix sp.]|uniref:tetratricopeptide repeat protein n=1 Tax=Planktothrix sp. TaxID=3088171 RepID=UPI0038D36DE8
METWEYYLEQANSFDKDQQWEKAIAAYKKALELNPNLPGIHQKIGDILQQQAASERTHLLNLYQQKIQQNPDHLQTYYQALEISPKDTDLYLGLAKALTKQGRLDQAQLAYQKVLQLQPNHPQ